MVEKDKALLLGKRQKRLAFWLQHMPLCEVPEQSRERLEELYTTYARLLSKAVKGRPEEHAECEERMLAVERELEQMFESRRLMTGPLGVPAIKVS